MSAPAARAGRVELADVVREHAGILDGLTPAQRDVLRAIATCRTAALGGQAGIQPRKNLTSGRARSSCSWGFADDEGRDSLKWAGVQNELGTLLFRWPAGCLEENIIKLVPADRLEEFIKDPDGDSGDRLRTLAHRLGMAEKDFPAIKAKAPDLTELIIEAATGAVPGAMKDAEKGEKKALKKHAERWFKSIQGGGELAAKVFDFGLWPQLEKHLLPFLNAVRGAVSLSDIGKLPS